MQAFPYCMIEHLRGKKAGREHAATSVLPRRAQCFKDRAMRSKLERLIGAKGELASP